MSDVSWKKRNDFPTETNFRDSIARPTQFRIILKRVRHVIKISLCDRTSFLKRENCDRRCWLRSFSVLWFGL